MKLTNQQALQLIVILQDTLHEDMKTNAFHLSMKYRLLLLDSIMNQQSTELIDLQQGQDDE